MTIFNYVRTNGTPITKNVSMGSVYLDEHDTLDAALLDAEAGNEIFKATYESLGKVKQSLVVVPNKVVQKKKKNAKS